ncbi:zinc ribbon domain-containing protein [Natrinema marinum]|uniref:zinc ribbon domain-containing protein n=1 Tax=Natrinema marinum TaxID=2961598 RepID=UPI0020C8A374|nr:zinc ribbon domain-containing protein [Natrinema marinum]
MSLLLLGAVLLLCFLPALLFLGFWHGLVAMQRRFLATHSRTPSGDTDLVVTWNDVIDAYADPRKDLLASSSAAGSVSADDDQCSACAAKNDPVASFCHRCLRTLE